MKNFGGRPSSRQRGEKKGEIQKTGECDGKLVLM